MSALSPTRRSLLGLGAALFTGGLRARLAFAQERSAGSAPRALVVLVLRGAADGLSMVVPHAEPAYYRDRPRLAIARPSSAPPSGAEGTALDLDGRFGMHPRLAPLMPLYRQNRLAWVHAVGLTDPTRSHFDAQRMLEAGATDPSLAHGGGLLNRALGAVRRDGSGDAWRAVAMGGALPEILQGPEPALAIDTLANFGVRAGRPAERDRLEAAYLELYQGAEGDPVRDAGRRALAAAARVRAIAAAAPAPAAGVRYPDGALGRSLRELRVLLRSDLGLRVAALDVGGWDTHVGQGGANDGRLAGLLGTLAQALAAFWQDLGDRAEGVTVLAVTEFGRTVAENGTGGTDHGHGSVALALGGSVRGGQLLGRWPGLETESRFERRDLAVTTDARHLLAEAAAHTLALAQVDELLPEPSARPVRPVGLFGVAGTAAEQRAEQGARP